MLQLSLLIVLGTQIANATSSGISMKPKFITNKMCPYAQKVWIALEVSQIDYEMNEISLYGPNGKPDWFWKLNPKGTVPVLDCGGKGVWADSELILDRLPELLPPGSLVLTASNPEHEKLVRTWRLDINAMLAIGRAAIQSGKNKSMQQQLCSMLQRLENNIIGPFLCGEEVTTADCAAFPFLWRLDTASYLDDYPNLRKWLEHCQTYHPAFSTTIQPSWWWWW